MKTATPDSESARLAPVDHMGAFRLVLLISSVSLLALFLAYVVSAPPNIDSERYLQIADGDLHAVPGPFSSRVLHALAASRLARLGGRSLEVAFQALAPVLLVTLVATCFLIARPRDGDPRVLAWILSVPALTVLVGQIYLPDLAHTAGLACFFLLLSRRRHGLALLVLLPLHLVRESTVLVWIFLIGGYLAGRQRRRAGAALAGALVATAMSAHVASLGQPNLHDLPQVAYLAGKVPINLMRNVAGIVPYTNTLAANNAKLFPDPPRWTWRLPRGIDGGRLHTVGIYGFDVRGPLRTATTLLTSFGAIPLLILLALSRQRLALVERLEPWQKMALLYGLFCFFTAPLLGASVGRLVTYAWPAFWLAAPAIWLGATNESSYRLTSVLPWHLLLCVLGWIQLAIGSNETLFMAGLLAAATIASVTVVGVARRAEG